MDRLNSSYPPLSTIAIQEGHTIHMVKSASNRASEQAVQTVRPLNNSNSLGGPEGFDEQVRNIFSWLCPTHHLHPTNTHDAQRKPKDRHGYHPASCLCAFSSLMGRMSRPDVDIFIWVYPLRSPQSNSCVRLSRIGDHMVDVVCGKAMI